LQDIRADIAYEFREKATDTTYLPLKYSTMLMSSSPAFDFCLYAAIALLESGYSDVRQYPVGKC
jgi:hypothetical protein